MVRDEIGAGQANVAVGGVHSIEVHVSDGECQAHGVIASHTYRSIEATMVTALNGICLWSVPIPEVNKSLGEQCRVGSRDAQVCVTPFGGVEAADIVPSDEG